MTCKECIHYSVCYITDEDVEKEVEEFGCDDFKDKSRIVELPCKVGDVIYYVVLEFDDALRSFAVIKSTHIARITVENYIAYECLNGRLFFNDHIGKDIFLTREEAEKALKENERK